MSIQIIMNHSPRNDDKIIMTSNRGAWIWMKIEQRKKIKAQMIRDYSGFKNLFS